MKAIRKHDTLYLKIDPNAPPKDSFIHVSKLIKNYKDSLERSISVADIGCATGAFVNYLMHCFPNDKIVGYEYLDSLIKSAKKFYPNILIKQASILEKNSIDEFNFDVVTCNGVLTIFDDLEKPVSNLAALVKPGGKLFIHGLFNPYDIDVFVKYRTSENYGTTEYESGWNIISQKTITKILTDNGAKNIQFHEFSISIDLDKNLSDPLRSWTENLESGERQIVNGLHLKQPQFILEADF
jgi:SAM-dependent methyltransferase